ncbi:phage head morphogenesis protein [Ochrobactrum chromiisoli]|uniref:Phage minor head protein n=1 Tax=Ochrobactrum chromiisoli TaxID=2993941 RepID=A0ABT3QUS9_9HYPH|nr:phage minor head protein [Ochrobactrum chromiisoli]MCX2699245.1 phage minor head protein [Ochrobactrum chromiisoli]
MFDRAGPSKKSAFIRSKKAERAYQSQLLKVARNVDEIVRRFSGLPDSADKIAAALERYALAVQPWATSVASRMVAEIDARDKATWRTVSETISKGLRDELRNAPTGKVVQALIDEQVTLIKSLPLEAAQRVQGLALEAVIGGGRSDDIVSAIMKTGDVTKSRAKMIARTEIGRASEALTEARAVGIGSEGYIWRTAKDSDVRHSHKMMEGKFVAWVSPPTLDGLTGHAGAVPNCRCYTEPVLPSV